MVKNPVIRIREELGLSRKDLAHATGLRYDALYLVEAGLVARPHRQLLEFLAAVGYDPADVTREYAVYRERLRKNVLAARNLGEKGRRNEECLSREKREALRP